MDAIGDLYVLGAPLIGRFEARYAGHALNNLLVRELVARPDAWRLVSRSDDTGRVHTQVDQDAELEAVG
jgi:UDP-3-O-[3-hydroxymyristoyl] N-acetylglucosamine deacetylase